MEKVNVYDVASDFVDLITRYKKRIKVYKRFIKECLIDEIERAEAETKIIVLEHAITEIMDILTDFELADY